MRGGGGLNIQREWKPGSISNVSNAEQRMFGSSAYLSLVSIALVNSATQQCLCLVKRKMRPIAQIVKVLEETCALHRLLSEHQFEGVFLSRF